MQNAGSTTEWWSCVCTGNALATQTLFIALDTIFEASLASMKKLKQSFGLQA